MESPRSRTNGLQDKMCLLSKTSSGAAGLRQVSTLRPETQQWPCLSRGCWLQWLSAARLLSGCRDPGGKGCLSTWTLRTLGQQTLSTRLEPPPPGHQRLTWLRHTAGAPDVLSDAGDGDDCGDTAGRGLPSARHWLTQ